jgi:hypothetical protein
MCWKSSSSCWSLYLLREEFLSAPIHSPLSSSPFRSFKWYHSRLRVLIDSNQSKIQGWRTRNGVRVLHTSMAKTTGCGISGWRCSSAENSDSLGCHGGHRLCPADELPRSRIEGHVRHQQQTTCFVLCVSLNSIRCTRRACLVESGRC